MHRPKPGWPGLGVTSDPWLGRTLAERYLLTRRIGRGASGDVYRAESLTIARQFAVKIIPLDSGVGAMDSQHIEARLHREIEALGHLRNPHIVSFYDVVPLDGRTVALVMDHIEGRTLETTVDDDGPLEMARACKILRQVANGIHEAHQAGMIHRDLKPDNLMIERLPAGDDFVHILDFGIVWREGDVHVTHGFVGTPSYASPEQAVGGELDRRADIYALGAVFFFMLTGRPPFLDDNVYNVLEAHVKTEPPKLTDIVTDLAFSVDVEALVARMLAKNADARPQTLAEVIEALDAFSGRLSTREQTSNQTSNSPASSNRQPRKALVDTGDIAGRRGTSLSEMSWVHLAPQQAQASDNRGASGPFSLSKPCAATPKAAILRGRTPLESLEAVEQLDADSRSLAESKTPSPLANSCSATTSFADAEAARRDSGIYEIPHLAGRLPDGGISMAAARSRQLAVVDASRSVLVGGIDQDFEVVFEVPAIPRLTALCLQGQAVYTGHADGNVACWPIADASDSSLHQNAVLHRNASTAPISAIDCDAGGRKLLFGTRAGGLYLAGHREPTIQPLRIHSGLAVDAVALNAPRDMFAVARADHSIAVFSLSSPTNLLHRFSAAAPIRHMAFSKDGYLLAVVCADKKLALYHVMTGKVVMRNDTMLKQPRSISFDDNDQLVGYCEVDGRIFGWDLHHNLVPHQQK